MKIAISGLGRMGSQIAQKLAESGHDVIAHNRSPGPIDTALTHKATGAYTKQDVVKAFGNKPAVIWLMIPNEITDAEIDSWLNLLPKGSVLIDGGNSDYRSTKSREARVRASGMELIDCGTSGGVWGYKNGFSMMIGGKKEIFTEIEEVFKTLAAPSGAYQYFGTSGSGHFVKMVHNAIEYGMMQSLAEGYRLLKEGPYQGLDLAEAGEVWQHGSVIVSWLNDLTRSALQENPTLEGINGVVSESGEARWALETAKELGIAMPAIQSAFDVRLRSQQGEVDFGTKVLSAMRNKFGGHELSPKI